MGVALAEESTVYKKYNKEGVVEFSDVPDKNAKSVPIPPMNTYKQKPLPKNFQKRVESVDPETYQSLVIASPVEDKIVRQNAGNITVSIASKPALNSAHRVRFVLDGNEKTTLLVSKPTVTFKNVSRGTHTVQAFIVNNAGKVLISSKSVKFHLQRFAFKPKS